MPAIKRLTAVAVLFAITVLLLALSGGTYARGEMLSAVQHCAGNTWRGGPFPGH